MLGRCFPYAAASLADQMKPVHDTVSATQVAHLRNVGREVVAMSHEGRCSCGNIQFELTASIAEQGAEAVIPCNPTRKTIIPYDAVAYRQRNLIERMFGRLKDFRRIATRYDKLGRNFFSAVLIAAIVIWWLN